MTAEGSRSTSIPKSRPHSRLVPHEIRLARAEGGNGKPEVVATIECERKACVMRVEACVHCERFARIEPHEAGYVMLCRSTDSVPPSCPEDTLDATQEIER